MAYAFDVVRELKDLPNQEGFEFIAVTKFNTEINCEIGKTEDAGFHYVKFKDTDFTYEELIGWKYKRKL